MRTRCGLALGGCTPGGAGHTRLRESRYTAYCSSVKGMRGLSARFVASIDNLQLQLRDEPDSFFDRQLIIVNCQLSIVNADPGSEYWIAALDSLKLSKIAQARALSMDSPTPTDPPKPETGLPPVQPPSGRFIAQLFVIPGLIILVLVLIILAANFLVAREQDPSHFLARLDSDNADIRWRAANDLAQVLKRGEPATQRWKADPSFALDLTERLDRAFQALVEDEKLLGGQIAKSTDKDKHLQWRKLRTQRDHVSFLAAALGEFHIAAGAPVLCDLLKYDSSPDVKNNTQQRRMTLWALMNLGENVKGYAKIDPEQQQAIVAKLKEEASATTPRAAWARTALYYIDKSLATSDVVKIDERLIASAKADDQFLRKLVAMSFNFWDGPKVEETLLELSEDKGRGTMLRLEEND